VFHRRRKAPCGTPSQSVLKNMNQGTRRRSISEIMAMSSMASLWERRNSKSFANLRQRFSQPKVRSTTQRLGST